MHLFAITFIKQVIATAVHFQTLFLSKPTNQNSPKQPKRQELLFQMHSHYLLLQISIVFHERESFCTLRGVGNIFCSCPLD